MIHDERILLGRLPGAVVLGLLLLNQTSCGWLWSEQYEWDPSRCAPGCSRCHNGVCEIEGGAPDRSIPDLGRDAPANPGDSLADRKVVSGDGHSEQVVPSDVRPPDMYKGEAPPCAGMTCPLGCNVNVAQFRCYRLAPSNFTVKGKYNQAVIALDASPADVRIDTTTGEVKLGAATLRPPGNQGQMTGGIYWDVVTQAATAEVPNPPELSVFLVGSINIPADKTLHVVGGRPLAIYSKGNVTIGGTVIAEVRPGDITPGPGGSAGGQSHSAGATCPGAGEGGAGGPTGSAVPAGGGGGGGRGAAGGAGGCGKWLTVISCDAAAGSGGTANGRVELVPLYGGCGGGGGGAENSGYGGGGGGAIQISADGVMTLDGKITVPGAGGGSGYGGGGGGGSGGAILLEAYEITGKGILAANGGGGGSGRQLDGSSGQAGQCGQASTSFALGGVANRGSGGNGGSVQDAAKPGAQAENGGGGGGAAGRIRLVANAISTAQMTVSPAPSMRAGVPVW